MRNIWIKISKKLTSKLTCSPFLSLFSFSKLQLAKNTPKISVKQPWKTPSSAASNLSAPSLPMVISLNFLFQSTLWFLQRLTAYAPPQPSAAFLKSPFSCLILIGSFNSTSWIHSSLFWGSTWLLKEPSTLQGQWPAEKIENEPQIIKI